MQKTSVCHNKKHFPDSTQFITVWRCSRKKRSFSPTTYNLNNWTDWQCKQITDKKRRFLMYLGITNIHKQKRCLFFSFYRTHSPFPFIQDIVWCKFLTRRRVLVTLKCENQHEIFTRTSVLSHLVTLHAKPAFFAKLLKVFFTKKLTNPLCRVWRNSLNLWTHWIGFMNSRSIEFALVGKSQNLKSSIATIPSDEYLCGK